jgi:hypothetical protein
MGIRRAQGRNLRKVQNQKIILRKESVAMNTSKNPTVKAPQEPYRFSKRLGSTTFHVNVHSSRTNTDTANDKIAHLIRNDAAMGKVVNL